MQQLQNAVMREIDRQTNTHRDRKVDTHTYRQRHTQQERQRELVIHTSAYTTQKETETKRDRQT